MAKKLIDIVSNGTVAQQEIVFEDATGADAGAIAPARSLQVGGVLVAPANPIPVNDLGIGLPGETAATADTSSAGLVGLLKRVLVRLTSLFQGVAGTPNTNVITVQGISEGAAVSVSVVSAQRTPALTRATAAGSIVAGATYVSVANIGNANATVLGQVIEPGLSIPFPTRAGETLAAISYDATGTTLLIQRQA